MMQAIPAAIAAMGGWGTALAAGSAAFTAISGYQQGMYQSRVAANNAQIANDNAKRVTQETAVKAQEQDWQAQTEMGALLANLGASGLSVGTGSAALRRKSQENLAAKDRAYTTYEGETQATGYKQQSQDFTAEAAANRSAAQNALISGVLDIGSSLVGGASKVNVAKAKRINAGIGSKPIISQASRNGG